jgi:putative antirepressor protein antB
MKALIKITETNGQRAVNARDLHQFLGVKTQFKDWINRRIEEYQFIKGQDFEVLLKNEQNSSGGRPAKEYALSLDMAKELSMVERTERGREARRYFIEMEKIAHAKRIEAPKFQRTNINSVSVKRVELINVIRDNLKWGDMHKVANELGLSTSYIKRVMVDKVHNTEQADMVVKALYERAMQNKNQVLFSYQEMIDMLRN